MSGRIDVIYFVISLLWRRRIIIYLVLLIDFGSLELSVINFDAYLLKLMQYEWQDIFYPLLFSPLLEVFFYCLCFILTSMLVLGQLLVQLVPCYPAHIELLHSCTSSLLLWANKLRLVLIKKFDSLINCQKLNVINFEQFIHVMILQNFWQIVECIIEYHQWHSHTVTAEHRLEWKQLKDWLQTTPAHMENLTLTDFTVPFCSLGILLIRTQNCHLQWYSLNVRLVMFRWSKFNRILIH